MGGLFNRPCIDCGQLTRGASRCPEHEQQRRKALRKPDSPQRKAKKAQQYDYQYRKRAKIVRNFATECHLCGQGYRPDDPWQADHLDPGNPNSELAPAHRSCNLRRGNKPLTPKNRR